MVPAGVIKLVPLRTHLMVADALTKSLPSPAHIKHREIMLGHVPFSLYLSQPVVTVGVSPPREFLKVPPTYFQIVVGKGESDKGDLVGRIEAQTAQYGLSFKGSSKV
jgi:hypothetical protein